jgi:hypothetical protein
MRNSGAILPMTNWEQFESETFVEKGDLDICTPGGRRYWADNYYGWAAQWGAYKLVSLTSAMVAELQLDNLPYLVQKAAGSIASSGWDALTFLAEIKHTRRMFSDVVTKLDSLVKEGLPYREAHNLWLEGRYGWRTLTYDIRDLHDVLLNFDAKRTRYNQKAGESANYMIVNTFDKSEVSGHVWLTHHDVVSMVVNYRASVVADISIPRLQFNPVTTAWEVTRLSFVVDWLLNVGQALDAAYFLLLVKDYKAAAGYRVDFTGESSSTVKSADAGYTINDCRRGYTSSGYYEYREPAYVSTLPRLKLRMNKWKALDLLSLVIQRL